MNKEKTHRLHGLPPASGIEPEVLILGSFPGGQSLARREYYANPRNHFWQIIESLLGIPGDMPYAERVSHLNARRIALWDVIRSCTRTGSSDATLGDVEPNDIPLFVQERKTIRLIALNGKAAEHHFARSVHDDGRLRGIAILTLPSTSPANAGCSMDQKIMRWREIILRTGEEEIPESFPDVHGKVHGKTAMVKKRGT
jgi:TDG/mug DNA glycosylase family protein